MRVYVEVSKNHGIPIMDVIKGKFKPEIRLLILYYNHQFHLEKHELDEIEQKQKEMMKGSE